MTSKEKASLTRILIDLIKADKIIDSREMDLYNKVKTAYGITRDDERNAYAQTLSEAVNSFRNHDIDKKRKLLELFSEMTMSDGFCAREEALLMMMLTLCFKAEGQPCDVISTVIEESWFDERQVLYVESYHDKDINFAITTDYRNISGELKLCGLEFVYLPHIVHHYITTNKTMLRDVMAMLSPSLTESTISNMLMKIKLFKTDTFCIEQLHHKLGFEALAATPPALMMRVSQSRVGDKVYTNFLRVEVSADVLAEVRGIVDLFLGFNGSDRVIISHKRDEEGSFLYSGFYRQIFEILTLQKSVECHMLMDFCKGTITFPELEISLNEISRKEKAFYTLFIYEAVRTGEKDETGHVRINGGIDFRRPVSKSSYEAYERRMQLLQRRYARIYRAFGAERDEVPDITNPTIRRPLISKIKSAVLKHSEKVYEADRFVISNPNRLGIYSISAIPESFICVDFEHEKPISIYDSALFKELDSIK